MRCFTLIKLIYLDMDGHMLCMIPFDHLKNSGPPFLRIPTVQWEKNAAGWAYYLLPPLRSGFL